MKVEELSALKGKQIIITSIKRDSPQSHAMNVPPPSLTKGDELSVPPHQVQTLHCARLIPI